MPRPPAPSPQRCRTCPHKAAEEALGSPPPQTKWIQSTPRNAAAPAPPALCGLSVAAGTPSRDVWGHGSPPPPV